MKRILLCCVLLTPFALVAQSCCEKTPTGEFAALASNTAFQNAHDEPVSFDFKAEGADFTFPTQDGKDGRGYIIRADEPTRNYLFVIHEWWGLNDYIRQTAEQLKSDLENVTVICLDLYDGKVATTREDASKYMQGADEKRIKTILHGAMEYAGPNVQIATIGWCFGGGWSLQASIELGDQAAGCVMYYGMPEKDVDRLASLNTDVLGIFASKDGWITAEIVSTFEQNMQALDLGIDIVVFEAEHAFANPSNPHFDKHSAKEAYQITLEFLTGHFAN
jgi:carboxymethylenebutenolidase